MIEKNIKVWIGGSAGITDPIHLSQYDTGWRFIFSIYIGNSVYRPSETATVLLEGRKADGTVFAVQGIFSDGVATVECTASITAAVGIVDCELRISEGGKTVGTANFEMIVEAAPLRGYVASGDDFSAVQQALDSSEVAASNAEISAAAAAGSAEDSEAYAIGKRDGVDVDSDDPAYHNNSKYFADMAKDYSEHIADPVNGIVTTWLQENISQETGYALDRSLASDQAAAPADLVGELKSAITDVTKEVLAVYPFSSNLHDKSKDESGKSVKNGQVTGDTADTDTVASHSISSWIPVVAGEKYILSGSASTCRVQFCNAAKVLVANMEVKVRNTAFTIPDGCTQMRFSCATTAMSTDQMLTKGETAPVYNDYQEKIVVDSELSSASKNPIQNSTLKILFDGILQSSNSWYSGTDADWDDMDDYPVNKIVGIQSGNLVSHAPAQNNYFISYSISRDSSGGNGRIQYYIAFNSTPRQYYRVYINNAWGAWKEIITSNSVTSSTGRSETLVASQKLVTELAQNSESIGMLTGYPDHIYCIGDSLTAGYVSLSEGAYLTYYNYPYFLSKILNTPVDKYATSGYTTSDIWDHYAAEIGAIQNSLVFIWLGTNAGVTNTVDTDCVGSDISEYANTYTGDYGRIIKTLVDNGNKVILCQIFAGGGATGVSTSNLAIKALATRFECKCIELSSADITALQDSKLHTNEYGDVDVTHFSCMGYSYVANFFSKRANAIALSDPAYFCIRKNQSA